MSSKLSCSHRDHRRDPSPVEPEVLERLVSVRDRRKMFEGSGEVAQESQDDKCVGGSQKNRDRADLTKVALSPPSCSPRRALSPMQRVLSYLGTSSWRLQPTIRFPLPLLVSALLVYKYRSEPLTGEVRSHLCKCHKDQRHNI